MIVIDIHFTLFRGRGRWGMFQDRLGMIFGDLVRPFQDCTGSLIHVSCICGLK